jgi:hypothetical protein
MRKRTIAAAVGVIAVMRRREAAAFVARPRMQARGTQTQGAAFYRQPLLERSV